MNSYFLQEKNCRHSLRSRVFDNILEYLPPSEIIRCSEVSRHWHWITSQFPQQLVSRKIQELVSTVLLMGRPGQEENTDIVCRVLKKFLIDRKENFPLAIYPKGKFTSWISHDKTYVAMFKTFTQFLQAAKDNARSLLDMPLTKVSETFAHKLIDMDSHDQRIYPLLKQCIGSKSDWNEFQCLINALDCEILGRMLIKAYESHDPQEVYGFIVLLKMAFQQTWELPAPESACKNTYLQKTVFFEEPQLSTFIELPRFLELVLFRRSRREERLIYEHINDKSLFSRLFANSIKEIPPSEWRNKGKVILDFFETFPWDSFWEETFQNAGDSFTREIGKCFADFFRKDASPRKKTECLHKLEGLVPNARNTFRYIFGHLHFPMLQKSRTSFPSCMRPLNFIREHPVIHCGDVCIGITQEDRVTALSAYNKKEKRLLWELQPINLFPEAREEPGDLLYCPRNDSELALMHHRSSLMLLIEAADGTIKHSIPMPGFLRKMAIPQLHFSPCGFVYYKAIVGDIEMLFGGEIGTAWQPSFQMRTSLPLSPQEHFVSLHSPLDATWTIIDKSGGFCIETLYNSLRIKGDYLYTLDESGRLTRQTIGLTKVRFLPFGEKQSIVIEGRPSQCKILDVCNDGTVVCIAEVGWSTKFYFVNFGYMTSKIMKKEIESDNPEYFVDTKNSVLWIWDKKEKELSTHTFSQSKKIENMTYTGDFRFTYADDRNHLFCI